MTLLTIAQNTLREIPGFEVPAGIVGNDNETAVLALALINRSLFETRRRSNWEQLAVRHTITTVLDQEEYDLPSDWKRFMSGTWWDLTNRWPMRGPASPVEWESLKTRDITSTLRRWFRIYKSSTSNERKIYLFPIPEASGDEVTLEYISNGIVEDSTGALQEKFLADDDISLLDEDVISLGFKWRFLKTKGLPYVEEFRDYEVAIADLKSDKGPGILDLRGLNTLTRRRAAPFFRTQEGDFPS